MLTNVPILKKKKTTAFSNFGLIMLNIKNIYFVEESFFPENRYFSNIMKIQIQLQIF